MTEQTRPDNGSANRVVCRALTVGVLLSLALMLAAVVMAVLRPSLLSDQVLPVNELPAALLAGSPMAFFGLGILVLLLTPPLREFVLLLTYAQQRRWLFVVIAVTVLVILGLSIYLGLTR